VLGGEARGVDEGDWFSADAGVEALAAILKGPDVGAKGTERLAGG